MLSSLVICPVYNEQATIKQFWQELRQYYQGDVVFIDDGSTDESAYFLANIEDDNVFCIRHRQRQGYGRALRCGFSFALEQGYKKVVTIDADLQHRPQHIGVFLDKLSQWEVVLGSRYIKIDKILNVPGQRLIINRYIAQLLAILFKVEFSDPFCGFRGYQNSFLRKCILVQDSYGIGVEILLEIVRSCVCFSEVAVAAIYFKDQRTFLDGLNDPRRRLLHYLEVISGKLKELGGQEKIFVCKSSS